MPRTLKNKIRKCMICITSNTSVIKSNHCDNVILAQCSKIHYIKYIFTLFNHFKDATSESAKMKLFDDVILAVYSTIHLLPKSAILVSYIQ